ncbi:MAG: collagen-binding domain-containing protein [Ferrimicrobium sp.]
MTRRSIFMTKGSVLRSTMAAAALVGAVGLSAVETTSISTHSLPGGVKLAASGSCSGTGSLGPAGCFGLYVIGNATVGGNDTTGAAAFQGSVTETGPSFTIDGGQTYGPNNASFIAPIATGTFNIGNGNWYAPSATKINSNGSGHQLSANPLDFAAANATLTSDSKSWSSDFKTNNMTLTIAPGYTTLTGTNPSLDVFNATASELAPHFGYTLTITVPSKATVLINVSGSTPDFSNLSTITGVNPSHVLWNFNQATTLTLNPKIQWIGAILAPTATLSGAVQIDGNVIVNNFESVESTLPPEVHGKTALFDGSIPQSPEVPTYSITKSASVPSISPTTTTGTTTDSWILTPTVSGILAGGDTVTLTDTLPTYNGYVVYGANSTIMQTGSGITQFTKCSISSNVLTCSYTVPTDITTEVAPTFATVTVPFTVANNAPTGIITNTVDFFLNKDTPATATATVTITAPPTTPPPTVPSPTFKVAKTVDSSTSLTLTTPPTTPTGGFSFAITSSVQGQVSKALEVVDPLPTYAGLSFQTPVATDINTSFTQGSCSIVGSSSNNGGGSVACFFDPINSNQNFHSYTNIATITVPFTLANTVLPGTFSNTANVSYDGGSTPSNTATVTLTSPPSTAPSSAVVPPTTPSSAVVPPTAPSSAVVSTVTVPATHTGEPWSGGLLWYALDGLVAAIGGSLLLISIRRRRAA